MGQAASAEPDFEEIPMGLDDKIKNSTEKVTGSAKEKLGDATGDDETKAEGKADQSKGSLKNAGENVKDAFKS